jgi:hypothetical protein
MFKLLRVRILTQPAAALLNGNEIEIANQTLVKTLGSATLIRYSHGKLNAILSRGGLRGESKTVFHPLNGLLDSSFNVPHQLIESPLTHTHLSLAPPITMPIWRQINILMTYKHLI